MTGISGQWFKPFRADHRQFSRRIAVRLLLARPDASRPIWADPHHEEHEKWWLTKKLDVFNHWFNRQAQNYKKVIGWALDHRLAMVLMAVLSFFASFLLPASGPDGVGNRRLSVSAPAGLRYDQGRLPSPRFARCSSSAACSSSSFPWMPNTIPSRLVFRQVGTAFLFRRTTARSSS